MSCSDTRCATGCQGNAGHAESARATCSMELQRRTERGHVVACSSAADFIPTGTNLRENKKRSHGYLTGSMQHRDAQPRSAVSAIQFEPWRRAASYVLWQSRAVSRLDLVTVLAYLPSSRPAHVKSVCMAQLDQCSRGQTTK
jgi:hypothetical protein